MTSITLMGLLTPSASLALSQKLVSANLVHFFTLAKGHTCKPALTTLERDMDLGAVKLLQHLSFSSGHLVNQPEDGANKLQNGEVEGSEESV